MMDKGRERWRRMILLWYLPVHDVLFLSGANFLHIGFSYRRMLEETFAASNDIFHIRIAIMADITMILVLISMITFIIHNFKPSFHCFIYVHVPCDGHDFCIIFNSCLAASLLQTPSQSPHVYALIICK